MCNQKLHDAYKVNINLDATCTHIQDDPQGDTLFTSQTHTIKSPLYTPPVDFL